ncbi:MAG: amidohydrolase, partial [Anaerolineae bacterium]|nr:amidohydrolase [Anaerolineae bacterium]
YGSDYPLLICPRQQSEPDFRPFLTQIEALGLADDVYAAIMGENMARLLGVASETTEVKVEKSKRKNDVGDDQASTLSGIQGFMAVRLVVDEWPETAAVFEQFGIPWQDNPVPSWEPIIQAAAARGLGSKEQQSLLEALNKAIS